MYQEAVALAQEALVEVKTTENSRPSFELKKLCRSLQSAADDLIKLAQTGHRKPVETAYSSLSLQFMEFRHQISAKTASNSSSSSRMIPAASASTVQSLSNELILRCSSWIPQHVVHSVFPRLSSSAHRLSIEFPNLLGVAEVGFSELVKLCRQPKPRCLSQIAVAGL